VLILNKVPALFAHIALSQVEMMEEQ